MTEGPGPAGADSLKALYRDAIRAHAANPYGFERPVAATHAHELYNALCGDRVHLLLRLEQDTIAEAGFHGEACAICMASASLLCQLAPGKATQQLRRLATELAEALTRPVGGGDLPETLHPLLGVRPYPSRVRCATLPWEAAVAALDKT